MDFEVFPSRVGPACSFQDAAVIKDRVVACEGVDLQHTAEVAQVLPGMLAPAVFRILEPYRRVRAVAPAPRVRLVAAPP